MTRRIAILTHSTNPRGGVVHAMQLAEALCRQGEDATLIAPALPGQRFFRAPHCETLLIPAAPAQTTVAMVETRIGEIAAAMRGQRFDIYHAQDPISANALANLRADGAIPGFIRTVHHLDDFADARLARWQDRGWQAAAMLLTVSRLWQEKLSRLSGRHVHQTSNGVDHRRFTPQGDQGGQALGLPDGKFFLSLGGIEHRKNTLGVLHAFLELHATRPDVRLVIAGGASLLDHSFAHGAFATVLRDATPEARAAVRVLGVIDDSAMPALYRAAHALVAPAFMEGFGLCPLEAMACGTPAIVSAIRPFTDHMAYDEALFVDPHDPSSIAQAMARSLDEAEHRRLSQLGPQTAARFSWDRVAEDHRCLYEVFAEEHLSHA
ncbi:MSMEG_0565 family glycosyltransferase [Acidisoma cellulosilytica]|uniref:MSMEG_0565 family glycosyltransferase n=1 Tax=Acidisoma cellulosilyticum TaxID=2802395 RepID=A0A963YZL0_9PROT|nr:MSMEG_0565 family glycosyltransferase [Acidisoma cellulosilyticum]MCB8879789.1 MSMEG_0565 family glycosyltransferase [Acidisoma cellulosilyticum]